MSVNWIGQNMQEAELEWQEKELNELQLKEIVSQKKKNFTSPTQQQNKPEELTSQVICLTFVFIL